MTIGSLLRNETKVDKLLARFPKAEKLVIHSEGINNIDSTGVPGST